MRTLRILLLSLLPFLVRGQSNIVYLPGSTPDNTVVARNNLYTNGTSNLGGVVDTVGSVVGLPIGAVRVRPQDSLVYVFNGRLTGKKWSLIGTAGTAGVSSLNVNGGGPQTGAVSITIPTNTNQLTNGANFITAAGAPVQSVNGTTGAVVIDGSETKVTGDNTYIQVAGSGTVSTPYQAKWLFHALNADSIGHKFVDMTGITDTYVLAYQLAGNKLVWVAQTGGGGGGISTLNGLTASTQTFATGTSGTDFNISSSGSVHTFNFPNSSSSTRGLLAAADFITFAAKQSQLNGTGLVRMTGTTVSYDNSAFLTANQTINLSPNAGGDVTGAASGTTSLTPTFTIGANKVTYAKFQQASAGSVLLGAQTAGNYQEITLGSGLTMSAGVLTATGSGFADPLTTNGDIIARISGSTTRLGQGSNGQFLGIQSGLLGYYTPNVLYTFNVKDYGAVGDGVTNDLAAINSCFAAAMAYPLQATIVFPGGTYLINGAITNVTRAVLIQGINATIIASGGTTYNVFNIANDSVRLYGMKMVGSATAQTGCNINGFKYFDIQDCEFTGLSRGLRFANTSSAFNAGNVNLCNFYSNLIGLFSDTLGEYVTVSNCLLKSNTVAIQDDGGNNIYASDNVNSNTTAFKFTGGSNNSHGIIANPNGNHNGASFDVSGASFGETIIGGHFYEGTMTFTNSSNWRFTGGCIISPSTLTITNCANMDFSQASVFSTYGTTRNFSGNLNKPRFNENFGDIASSITTPNGSVTPLVDSIGGYGYRSVMTSDTLDLGIARWQYRSLSTDDTIKSIIHPTIGRTYRVEIIPNGHNFVMLDNTKISGTYNSSAAINIYYLECIDDGADPRFLVSVSQPGVLTSRPTAGVGWGRITGTGSASGNNLTKSGPDGTAFTVWAVPDKVLGGGDGYYVAQAASTNANIIWGLSTNPVQNSYNSINYAIYFFSTSGAANNVNIAESGTIISSGLGGTNWSTNDSFRIKVTGTTVTYEKYSAGTWNVFFTSTHAVPSYPLIPQVAIRALTTFTNPRLYGAQVTNNLQSYFAVPYPSNLNATQPGGGITSVGTFSGSSQVNGASISGSSIIFGPADGTNPGMIKASGTQTLGATITMPAPKFTGLTSAGVNDSVLMWNPSTNQVEMKSSSLNLFAENGATWTGGNTLTAFSGAFNQNSTVSGAGFSLAIGTSGSKLSAFTIASTAGVYVQSDSGFAVQPTAGGYKFSFQVKGSPNLLGIGSSLFSAKAIYVDTLNNIAIGTLAGSPASGQFGAGRSVNLAGVILTGTMAEQYATFTSNVFLTVNSARHIYIDATSGSVTVTLPAVSACVSNSTGVLFYVKRIDNSGNTVTIATTGSDVIDNAATTTLASMASKQFQAVGTTTWWIN